MPSIAASEEGAECGARQPASRWSAGRRRAPRKGPTPRDPHPPQSLWVPESWRGPAFATPVGASQKLLAPLGAPTPLFEGKEKLVPAKAGKSKGEPGSPKK